MAQALLELLVREDVEAGVRGVPHGGGAEAGEEGGYAAGAVDVAGGAEDGAVRVQGGLVADLDDGQGHEDEAGEGTGEGAGEEVGGVGELRQGGGGGAVVMVRHRGGQGRGVLADGVERRKIDGGTDAGAQGRGHGAPPEGGDGIGRAGDVADGGADRVRAGLLDAGLEEVEGLQEHGAEDAGAQASDEVESWWKGEGEEVFVSITGVVLSHSSDTGRLFVAYNSTTCRAGLPAVA